MMRHSSKWYLARSGTGILPRKVGLAMNSVEKAFKFQFCFPLCGHVCVYLMHQQIIAAALPRQ